MILDKGDEVNMVKIKYTEKDIENYRNSAETKTQLEITSSVIAIVELLDKKNIITKKEFSKTKNEIKKLQEETLRKRLKTFSVRK